MVESDLQTIAPAPGAAAIARDLEEVRARTLDLIGHLDGDQLERVHSPIMSPLVWDLAHMAAYEDLWLVHRHAGRPLLRDDLAAVYDAFETPRSVRGRVELLDCEQTLRYMREVRERTLAAIADHGVGDGFLHELVLRHELQHSETMLQTMALAGILPDALPADGAPSEQASTEQASTEQASTEQASTEQASTEQASTAGEWIELEAGEFEIGARREGFAYDNERPCHPVRLDGFLISTRPLSVGQWRQFAADGGYERRELFSEEGWAWRAQQADPFGRASLDGQEDDEPACHLSFFEAEAIASWCGARLPTEAEWERAARTQARAAQAGALAGRRRVWEWTATEFDGYPGFRAHPYREYSEVFFASGYRVLRGGSWATHPRVASSTFRNWDLPQRRQIFAGVRLAKDL